MAQQIPDPATNVSPADIQPTTKERVLKGLGGFIAGGSGANTQQLDDVIASHHQKRLDEAKMHRQNASTYAGVLATGFDPKTGQKLSPEQEAQYQNWYETSWAAYEKAAGVSKDTKGALQRAKMIVEHLIGRGKQQREEQQQQSPQGQPPPSGGGMTPPPSANATPVSPASGGAAPKPGMSAPPKYDNQAAMAAPALRQDIEDNRAFNFWKRQQDLLKQYKIEEEEAKAKAQAAARASGAAPRPVFSRPIGVLDARSMAMMGKMFPGDDGQPMDISQMPESMALQPYVTRNSQGQWVTQYQPISPSQSTVTVGNETYAISPYDKSKLPQGAGTDLGEHNVPRTGTHEAVAVDAQGNPVKQSLQTTSTPQTTGVKRGGLTPPPKASGTGTPRATGGQPTGGKPAYMTPGMYNQQIQRVTPVREAATQVFGDPTQPNLPALKNFAHLADSQESRERLGTALKLTFDSLEQQEKQHGSLITLIQAYGGVPQAVAAAKAGIMQDVISKLTPDEQAAYDATISSFSSVVGLRSLTKASAAQFSVKALERDLPIIGVTAANARQFNDKLAHIAELVYNGSRTISDQVMPPDEKAFYKKQVDEMSKGSGRGGMSTPPKLNAPAKLSPEAKAYLKAHPELGVTVP